MNDLLHNLRNALANDLGRQVIQFDKVLGTGFQLSTGRPVALFVEQLATPDLIRVSDAGETWIDLVMHGVADPKPTPPEVRRLRRTCKMQGAGWDEKHREIVITCAPNDFASAARRIISVALAIDGWRAWQEEAQKRPAYLEVVARELKSSAPKHGWDVDMRPTLRGKRSNWKVAARLHRKDTHAVVFPMMGESGDVVIQRALGFKADRNEPLVIVAGRGIAEDLKNAPEFDGWAIPVGYKSDDVAGIVMAAEKVAAWRMNNPVEMQA